MDHPTRYVGGDGAALTDPRRRHRLGELFSCHSILWKLPDDRLLDITVMLMSCRRWEGYWKAARPNLDAIHVGPLVVAVGITV